MIGIKEYKKTIFVLAILNIILVLLISALLIYNTRKQLEINKSIDEIDLTISRDAYTSAESLIKKTISTVSSKSDFMRLVKRACSVSAKTGRYDLAVELSGKALDKYKNEEKLLYIHLYSLLMNRDYKTAYSYINGNSAEIIPEALIISIVSRLHDKEAVAHVSDKKISAILDGSRNAEEYSYLYEYSKVHSVLNNYLLSLMAEGQYSRAYSLIQKENNINKIKNELAGLICYDNKEYEKSGKHFLEIIDRFDNFHEDPGLLLLLADTYMHRGDYEEAGKIYDIVIYEDNDYSWIPYVNLDWIDEKSGLSSCRTENAIDIFDDKELLRIHLLNQIQKSSYLKTNNTPANRQNIVAEYWKLYNDNLMSEKARIIFAKELYRMKNFQDLKIFLEKESLNGASDWLIFYKALANFNLKNYENALSMFLEYQRKTGNWHGLYNAAIIHMVQKEYRNAAELFSRLLSDIHARQAILSDIYLMLSIILYYEEDYAKSESYLQKSTRTGNRSIAAQYLKHYYDTKTVEAH